MASVMKTLLLNPPSFKNFDGGASSRWPATREIASYWYPVWLTYPAGMLPGSRLLDAPPHGITPEQTVEIDFIVSGEFDHAVVEFAESRPLSEIAGAGYRQNGGIHLNPPRPQLQTEDLDRLPFATEIYNRHPVIENYNVPFLLHPYVAFYTSRGCPALCTFCLWPQTVSGHAWRTRSIDSVAAEVDRALK